MKSKNININLLRTALIAAVLLLWESSARLGWYNSFFTSYPSAILEDLYDFIVSGDFWYHASITMTEAILGLLVGVILGLFLGIFLGQFRFTGKLFTPILSAINTIPQLAIAPIYVLWFGTGMQSKVFLAGLSAFFVVFFPTYNSIVNTSQSLIESSYMLGGNTNQTLFKVIVPSCMPYIFSGIRGAIAASLVGAIIGEYLGSAGGLGWMITYATSYFNVTRVLSSILVLLFVGITMNKILDYIEERTLRWNKQSDFSINKL